MDAHYQREMIDLIERVGALEQRHGHEPTNIIGRSKVVMLGNGKTSSFDAQKEITGLKERLTEMYVILTVLADTIDTQAGQIEGLVELMAKHGIE